MRPLLLRLLPLLLLGLLSGGCMPIREVDETAYAISIIIDKSESNKIKVGLRIPVPRLVGKVQGQAIGGGSQGGQELYVSTSVDAPTILAGINMMQLYTARSISLEHARALVISEALARDVGVEDQVTPILRYPETRSNMYVLIARGDPMRMLSENRPSLEISISRFIELQARAADLTGLAAKTRVDDFYNHLKSRGSDAVAGILSLNEDVVAARKAKELEQAGGPVASDQKSQEDIMKKQEQRLGETEQTKEPEAPARTAGSFSPGSLPREGGNALEWVGLAVFNNDKMVGDLNGNESIAYRLLTGRLATATFTVAAMDNPSQLFTVELSQGRNPSIDTKLEGDQATINVKLVVEANLLLSTAQEPLESEGQLRRVEESVKYSLMAWIESAISKTQNWEADIFGFGEFFRHHFLTWQEWEKVDWHQLYKKADINVDLNVVLRRPGLLLETAKVK